MPNGVLQGERNSPGYTGRGEALVFDDAGAFPHFKGLAMKTISEYRRHVEECKALLRRAKTPEEKKMIMQMAETWESLAVAREQRLAKGEISGDD